jgi:hypothetical protein
VLRESREIADGRAWLEKISHEAKTDNMDLTTEPISGRRPVDYCHTRKCRVKEY